MSLSAKLGNTPLPFARRALIWEHCIDLQFIFLTAPLTLNQWIYVDKPYNPIQSHYFPLYRSQTHLVAIAVRFLRASSTPALATQSPAAPCQGAVCELEAIVAFLWAPEQG